MKSTNTLLTIVATAIITGLAVYLFMKPAKTIDIPDETRSPTTICMDYDTVAPPTLTSKMVQTMVAKYSTTQLNNIQTATDNAVPKDARSIWFDLETFKKFLYHVEYNFGKNSSNESGKKLGIRIYYAAYPKNDEMKRLSQDQTDPTFSMNPDYENLHTLVMIPTISDSEGNNYDFNPLDIDSYNGFVRMEKSKQIPNFNSTYQVLSLGNMLPKKANMPINARNHGTLTPPGVTTWLNY